MVKAFRIHKPGGPEAMQWEDIDLPAPGPSQARVRHTAVGLNYIDTYHRSGLYPLPLPAGIGMEGAGIVEAVGSDVKDLVEGDRVAYAAGPPGSYSEARIIAADRLVKIPEGVSDQQAAAMMLKGMTTQYLIRRTYKVKAGDTILMHAAAGGVGLILCQWAAALGATVIGTVGDEEKATLAKAHGCHHTILYKQEDFVAKVKEITDGKGVPVVYDGVGKDTFMKSLDCLQPLGLMVAFGQSSGNVPPLDLGVLSAKGSLFLTRPTLMTYTAKRDDLVATTNDLFDAVKTGKVTIDINQTYALKDAVKAHQDLEGRKTTGSTVMQP
ncbi:quinone oxidoreductase family protein [Oceanibaculum pacificum]|uniref:Quinone oxidoreductase n=1 Tax=Oceanibaculum pacificum TaxID=580166 RepID=A0A154WH82_9PROT|nr:quinone oxidoreductase [Oceanibaculum pacificum]KZD12829.1 quinone oxidoreductase [Oceanibaculum pacificum]